MKQILFKIFVLTSAVSFSQNFESDMKLVYTKFNRAEKIAFNIEYVLHENHNADSKVITTNKGKYVKVKDQYISTYDSKYTLVSPKEIIMIDNQDKRIRVKKMKEQKKSENPDFMVQLKEYNKYISKTTSLNTNKADVIMYRIELNSKSPFPISAYELTIDKKQGYMLKMSLLYKTKLEKDETYKVTGDEVPRLDIFFNDINDKKLFAMNEFNEEFYYTKRNSKLFPSEKFKNYDIKEIL